MFLNSFKGIFSVWVNPVDLEGDQCLMHGRESNGNSLFEIFIQSDGAVVVNLENNGSPLLSISSNSALILPDETWKHILISWDTENVGPLRHIYINDSEEFNNQSIGGPYPNLVEYENTAKLGVLGWVLVGAVDGTLDTNIPFNGCVGQMYFSPGEYLDFSISSNRRKFISSLGKWVSLGDLGEIPTNSVPAFFYNGDATQFDQNQGDGPGGQENGVFEDCLEGIE